MSSGEQASEFSSFSQRIQPILAKHQEAMAAMLREMAAEASPFMFALVPELRNWLDDPASVEVSYDPDTDDVTIVDRRPKSQTRDSDASP